MCWDWLVGLISTGISTDSVPLFVLLSFICGRGKEEKRWLNGARLGCVRYSPFLFSTFSFSFRFRFPLRLSLILSLLFPYPRFDMI